MGYQVSFCIPEHNECELVLELVQSLLSNPDPNFQVVVSDNMTDNADPSEVYRDIHDERFRLYQTETALSRQENYLRALEYGEGEYLYMVLGRDWLDSGKIGGLLSLLRTARENRIDLLMDRKAVVSFRPYYGIEAINQFINSEHPTGLIISRASLLACQRRREYFIPGNTYPETFIKRDILAEGGAAAKISSGVYANLPTRTSLGRRVSGSDPFTDQTKMKNVYFSQGQVLKAYQDEIEMVLDDPRFHLTEAERTGFFQQKYRSLLQRSIIENKLSVQSEEYMMHYGMRRFYLPVDDMLKNLTAAALAGIKTEYRFAPRWKLGLLKDAYAVARNVINGVY